MKRKMVRIEEETFTSQNSGMWYSASVTLLAGFATSGYMRSAPAARRKVLRLLARMRDELGRVERS